ncbi:MAG: tryptophan synthase subunit alpha [Burkholderiaceae bacterium]|jgi:tryptophan synthase alpha chain|nr:tryptophan synthase subunit alpha [Burkholderiaceae bacterium]
MSRIQHTFSLLAAQGRKALIPFMTAGYPRADTTAALMRVLVEGGADIIELGVPFSDPMADGPVIQRASEVALAQGVSLRDVLGFVRAFRENNDQTPVVLMGYANPVERMGVDNFVREAAESGVDGVLVVDYPPEECGTFSSLMRAQGMDTIFLLAPTSSPARIGKVAALASGYVYCVSLKGVTGSSLLDKDEVAGMMATIRQSVTVPLGVGFGIQDAETAVAVSRMADGVVIGSRIIQALESDPTGAQARHFLSVVRQGLDSGVGVAS